MEQLERIVNELESENEMRAASNPEVKKSLSIVEDFLRHHPVLCYGGTAINNLLPKEKRFYDPTKDIPDYDFFSKTPQEHSMYLANKLHTAGIPDVEVRPGSHSGTFKVFANFEGVADITFLDKKLFDRLWKEEYKRDGIHYVSPNYLRMSMYLELSRPQGMVDRWVKVYKRLELLNSEYPLVCPRKQDEPQELTDSNRKKVESILKKYPVSLLGITASQIHNNKSKYNWYAPVSILAEKDVISKITEGEKIKEYEGSEILPPYTDILDENGNVVLRIHETQACHSYHQMKNGIRVASIPTILQIFFAFMYSGIHEDEIIRILCVAQRLMDIAKSSSKRRFSILTPKSCMGNQETLADIKKEKLELFVKYSKDKGSANFLKYFFTYRPSDNETKKQKIREQLRKTRRERLM